LTERETLRARLSEYMILSVFDCLDALPLTASGKTACRTSPDAAAAAVIAAFDELGTPGGDQRMGNV
jgi:hypothetical protein